MHTAPGFAPYHNLSSFTAINQVLDDQWFTPLPDDWQVFISDVRGSTQAIAEGRYRDVNTMGAASIASVANALGSSDFPFVFGGDGASLVVPPEHAAATGEALAGVARLAAQEFQLDLRVGSVALRTLREAGMDVQVARQELSHGRCIAAFRGGGLSFAEDLIKSDPAYAFASSQQHHGDLGGLSCRWNEIPSTQGCILSLLVLSRPRGDTEAYRSLFRLLDELLGGDLTTANPVKPEVMTYRSLRSMIDNERRYQHRAPWRWLARKMEIYAAAGIFSLGLHPFFFSPRRYAAAMRTHADYCKYDDMLRMVIDCSPQHAERIRAHLQSGYENNTLYFGLHHTDSSIMTCYVEGMGNGKHLHFIDGSNGGYAEAAREMKAQFALSQSRAKRPAMTDSVQRHVIDHA